MAVIETDFNDLADKFLKHFFKAMNVKSDFTDVHNYLAYKGLIIEFGDWYGQYLADNPEIVCPACGSQGDPKKEISVIDAPIKV